MVSPENVTASLDLVQAMVIPVMISASGTRGSRLFDCRSRLGCCKNFSPNITQLGSTQRRARDPQCPELFNDLTKAWGKREFLQVQIASFG